MRYFHRLVNPGEITTSGRRYSTPLVVRACDFAPGDLVSYDSLSGPVKCKVTGSHGALVDLVVTGRTHPVYREHEHLTSTARHLSRR